MPKKNISKNCANPVSVNNLVDLNVDSLCFPDIQCGGLNPILEDLYSYIEKIKDPEFDLGCLNPSDIDLNTVIQALIASHCELKETSSGDTTSEQTYSDINLCLKDTWDCDNCTECLGQNDPENVIQHLVSAVLSLRDQVKSHCNEIVDLGVRIDELETEISDLDCCNQEGLLGRLKLLENKVNTLENG